MIHLLAQGLWSPAQVIATTTVSSRPIIPDIEKIIAQTWTEQTSRPDSILFDGTMSRLESFQTQGPELHLNLSTTSYRIFLGTNLYHADLAQQFGRPALANAIGMSAALLTADGQLVMGRRNNRVAYYPNRIHPFAGSLEPRDVPNIFDGIRRELEEELRLDNDDVTDLRMLAIIEDRRLFQPEFIFFAQTPLTASALCDSLDQSEHDSLWMHDATADALERLLEQIDLEGGAVSDLFTPVAVGTLLMYGRFTFGVNWGEEHIERFFAAH
jgi:8-oxo-dGTP pyrophosphatase MutT (NUDIX family)